MVQNELILKLHVRPGNLMVTVQRARNLDAKDDNGFSDPYVILEFQKKKKKTKIIKKNLNPVFGEQFEFGFAMNSSSILRVVCMDHDTGPSSDDFIGEEYIDVAHQKMEVDLSIPLKPKDKGNKETNQHVFEAAAGMFVSQSAPSMSFQKYETAPPTIQSAPAIKKPSMSGLLNRGRKKEEEKQEEEDISQIEDKRIFAAFRVAQTDPRYIRLAEKLDPRFRSRGTLKKIVDPSSIPYFGHVVHAKRSMRGEQNRHLLKKVSEADSEGQMSNTYDMLQTNMKTECATRHLTLGLGLAFQAMPASVLLPGVGDAAASTAGGFAAGVVTETGVELATLAGRTAAETLLDEAVEVSIEESAMAYVEHRQKKTVDDSQQVERANATFIRTKIMLLYIGAPYTDDELYSRWESHRILIKRLYGSTREEDLAQMEEDKEMERKIKEITKNPEGTFNVADDLGVSPLWLLWRIYECWQTIYYDYLEEKKHVFSKKQFLEEKRARERYQDEKYLKELCLEDYPGIRKVMKDEKDLCVEMLVSCYKNHPNMEALIGTSEKDTKENIEFYWENMFDYFLKEYQIWAFEDSEDLSVQAIALVEPPNANPPNLPDWMGKRDTVKTIKQLGGSRAKELKQELRYGYDFRKQNIGKGGGIQVIHFVANRSEDLSDGTPLHQLVEIMLHTLNKTKPKYVQEYQKAKKWQSFFKSCGMEQREMEVTDDKLQIFWKEPDVTEQEMQAMEALRNAVRNELVLSIEVPKKKKPDSFKVKVICCKNLDGLDKTGTSDPFLELTFQKKEKKTLTHKKELNPVFNQEFEFSIKKDHIRTHAKILKIKCYDDNKFSRPQLIGMQKINVLTQKSGEISIPLQKKSVVNAQKDKKIKNTFGAVDKTCTSSTSSASGWGE